MVLFAALSCTSASRKPAQAGPPPEPKSRCELSFERRTGSFSKLSPETKKSLSEQQFAVAKLLAESTVPEIQARLEKLEKAPGCPRAMQLSQLEKDVNIRLDELQELNSNLQKASDWTDLMHTSRMFNDPKFGEGVACFAECSLAENVCRKECMIKENDLAVLREFGLSPNECVDSADGKKVLDRADFMRVFNGFIPELRKFVQFSAKPMMDVGPAIDQARAGLNDLQNQVNAKIKREPKYKCSPPAMPELLTKFSGGVARLADGRFGTGFWVKSGEQAILINAGQVARELSSAADDHDLLPRAGFYSYGEGLVLTPKEYAGPYLEVIPAETLPALGQKFYIVGFPHAAYSELKLYPCTFEGLFRGQNPPPNALLHVLKCADLDGSIDGMPGGPVIDEQGRVWSVITDEVKLTGNVIASPLGRDVQGKIQLGYLGAKSADLCLNARDWTRTHACQVANQR